MCPIVPTEGAGLFLRGGWLGYCLNLALSCPLLICPLLWAVRASWSLSLICLASSYCTDKTLLFLTKPRSYFSGSLRKRKEEFLRLAFQPCVPLVRGSPCTGSSSASFCICSPQRPSSPAHSPLPSPHLSLPASLACLHASRPRRPMSLSCEDKS